MASTRRMPLERRHSARSLGSTSSRPSLSRGGSSKSLGSASSRSAARVKRTIRRQSGDATNGFSFTTSLVDSLAMVAQVFLYPEDITAPRKESTSSSKKIKKANTSPETTMELSDGYHESSCEETYTTGTTNSTSSSTRTPPPNLMASPPPAFQNNVKRPIPVASPRSSFDPVFSSSFGTSPIARMRAPPVPQQEPKQSQQDEEQARLYSENFVADKHRKWRQQIKLQKQRLQEQSDDTSLITTCDPTSVSSKSSSNKSSSHHTTNAQAEPIAILQQLIRRAPCTDVSCDRQIQDEEEVSSSVDPKNNSLVDDTDTDDESSNFGTEATTSEFTNSDFLSEKQSDFTTSEFTSEYTTDASLSASGIQKTQSSESNTRSIKGVLKASSYDTASSVKSPSTLQRQEEEAKNFIKAFIQDLTRDGMVLIWHGPHGVDSTAFRRPCGVVASLQLGTPIGGVYSGPRLAWQKQDGKDGGSIDLFDIYSMDTPSPSQLDQYKFAIPDNTFFISLRSGKHVVFEASSDVEARRFIHGLRWVVARLSFNLVVGNPLVSCELLEVGNNKGGTSPQATPMEEEQWSKAMNDVTNHLVDKSLMVAEC